MTKTTNWTCDICKVSIEPENVHHFFLATSRREDEWDRTDANHFLAGDDCCDGCARKLEEAVHFIKIRAVRNETGGSLK